MTAAIHIAPGSSTPIYRQIGEQIRRAAAAGQLRPGDALPSVRALAEQLVVNPNTVARAYGELVRDGVLAAQQGRGYFVAEPRQVYSDAERRRRLDAALQSFLAEVALLGFARDDVLTAVDAGLAALTPPQEKPA